MRPGDGRLDPEDAAAKLTAGVRLLALGAASNALGTVNDVAALTARAHAVGAQVFVDGVHYASHHLPDVRGWDCDYFVCSAYKFYGPHVGVLWGRRDLLAALDAPKLAPASNQPPELLETGTLNHEGIVGARAAVDFLAGLAGLNGLAAEGAARRQRLARTVDVLHERGAQLLGELWNGLGEIAGVELYGPPPGSARTATLSFSVRGHDSTAVARSLSERGVFVSNGDFYATTAVRILGHERDGLVRAGCAAYTTSEEVGRLVEGVRHLKEGARR
jgi:selenocysteine lyase/cysteine desulfurase